MHIASSEGQPRDVAGRVMAMLLDASAPTRIPIAAITDNDGKRRFRECWRTSLKQLGMLLA